MSKYITKKPMINSTKQRREQTVFKNVFCPLMRAKVYTVLENGDTTYLGSVPLKGRRGLFKVNIPMRMAFLSSTGKLRIRVGAWGRMIHKNALIRVEFRGSLKTAAVDEIIAIEGKI